MKEWRKFGGYNKFVFIVRTLPWNIFERKTTVVFIDAGHKIQKPLLIPSFFLYYWKFFVICTTCFLFIFIIFSIHLGREYFSSKMLEIEEQRKLVASYSNKVKEKYNFISDQIIEVNNLLLEKGILQEQDNPDRLQLALDLDSLQTDTLDIVLNQFMTNLAIIPIGFPVNGEISSGFGFRIDPILGWGTDNHPGLDIKSNYGTYVRCTADGIVEFTGVNGGYGNLIVVNHGGKFQTLYGHLSEISVKKGDSVKANSVIGRVGSSGRSTGPHLHYEIRRNGKILNPLNFITLE